jgi:ethanolamine utilization microcompartment shell protein EutS
MANIQLPPDSTGKYVDTAPITDGGLTVQRQKIVIAGYSGSAEVAVISNAAVGSATYGLVVRVPHSATVTVAGSVGLNAGTNNIGFINNISATVVVAGTFNIGALTAGTQNIGYINNISATVTVVGTVNISATANVSIRSIYVSGQTPSGSRGPICIPVSTSANVTLVAAPGVGMAIYVTQVACSNAAGANTKARLGTSASVGQVTMMMVASGGGFVSQYVPLWKLSTNEALVGSVKPNASEALFNVHFFVASADAF